MLRLAILSLILALGCAAQGAAVETLAPTAAPQYVGGRSACAEFQRLVPQLSQGILTDAEIREKVKTIQSRGSTAEPSIRNASTSMLQAMTPVDIDAFLTGSERMAAACSAAGYLP